MAARTWCLWAQPSSWSLHCQGWSGRHAWRHKWPDSMPAGLGMLPDRWHSSAASKAWMELVSKYHDVGHMLSGPSTTMQPGCAKGAAGHALSCKQIPQHQHALSLKTGRSPIYIYLCSCGPSLATLAYS